MGKLLVCWQNEINFTCGYFWRPTLRRTRVLTSYETAREDNDKMNYCAPQCLHHSWPSANLGRSQTSLSFMLSFLLLLLHHSFLFLNFEFYFQKNFKLFKFFLRKNISICVGLVLWGSRRTELTSHGGLIGCLEWEAYKVINLGSHQGRAGKRWQRATVLLTGQ